MLAPALLLAAALHEFTLSSGDRVQCVAVDGRAALPPVTPFGAEERLRHLLGTDDGERQCPPDTIPKRIATAEPPLSLKAAPLAASSSHQWAVATQDVDNHGARATLNVWNPFVEQRGEFSLAQIWVTAGTGAALQTLEAGWQVYPSYYGDSRTRLFIFSTSNGYGPGSCYNLDCGRFVQTNSSVILGAPVECTSVEDGPQCELELEYARSNAGDWWLKVNGVPIGYYPAALFARTGLGERATTIAAGGEVVNDSPEGVETATNMGSGRAPAAGYQHAAYVRGISYIDPSNQYRLATSLSTTKDAGGYSTAFWQDGAIFFGGPGRPLSATTLEAASASSTVAGAPSALTVSYTIGATLSDAVLVGASIGKVRAPAKAVTLSAGANSVVQSIEVPAGTAPGTYDLVATVVRDRNGNGVIDDADQVLGTRTYPNAITIVPVRRRAAQ